MFEAANNMTMNTQGGGNVAPSQSVIALKPVSSPVEKEDTSDQKAIAMKQAQQKAAAERRASEEQKRQVTEDMLDELEQDIENMHNVGLRFSKHNDSGRTMIKVLDKENDQVIREIPAEDVLNLAAKMEEMIGILFDKEV